MTLRSAVRLSRKTKVYVCLSYQPPPPRIRLNRLERPSFRVCQLLGDQGTQGRPPRPRAPGPPSLPGLLNEQLVERKLHRLLSGVISAQVVGIHHKRTNRPLRLNHDYLGITVESRSTGYQPKPFSKGLGCMAQVGLAADAVQDVPPKPQN